MAKSAIDIDRLARQAQQAQQTEQAECVVDIAAVKLAATLWNIIVEPVTPKSQSEGGIILAEESRKVEEIQCCVGKVLYCGPSALEGKTASGIYLRAFAADIDKPSDLVGKFVLWERHTGQYVKLKRYKKSVVIISAPEIRCVVGDPDEIEFWIGA